MKISVKMKAMGLIVLLAFGNIPAMAGTLTAEEVAQIETAFGITLTPQEKTDLGNIVKPNSSAWRTAAESRIDTHRKAALTIQVEDSVGAPVPGATVAMKLNKNAFKFSGVARVEDFTDENNNLGANGTDVAYWKQVTTNMFNAVGCNNAFKPKITGQHDNIPAFMTWSADNNLDVRAHLMIWPGGTHLSTASTSDYAHYNVRGAYDTYTNNPTQGNKDALKAEVDNEITEWAGRWDVYEWDVINETRGNTDLQEVLGYDQEAHWFELGEANKVNPNAKLFINDNQIISDDTTGGYPSHRDKIISDDTTGGYPSHRDIYFTTIDRLVASNAPIHGIGFQNRYKWEHIDPAVAYSRLKDFGDRYGLSLAGTEFEIIDKDAFIPTEITRAEMTEETMTVYYSHALATGLNAWGYMIEDTSALSYYDGTIKLNGLAWYYVHRIRYNTDTNETTDVSGSASVAGAFKGDYDITVTYDGTDYPATATLSSNQTVVVTLGDVTIAPSPNAPVFTVDPINKPAADESVAYTGQSITNSATDIDGDTLTYSIVAGPTWLSMNSNGDLSGTPANADAGQNSWIVQVSDGSNPVTATLKITVDSSGGGGAPVTVNVSEDQYIHANQKDTVQALDTKLDTRISSESYARIPYLKFVAGSLPGTIATATLHVFSESELNEVQAWAVTDSSWDANTLTWNNAPSRVSLIGSGQASAANSWFTIDVASQITGGGTYSIALDEQGGGTREYLSSSRSSNGAYLYITFSGAGNNPPTFDSDPIIKTGAIQDVLFSSALDGNASDTDLDPMTFAKVSGPSWLNVATNGALTGTPLVGDVGDNSWKILVTDGTATNFATLAITVSVPLAIVSPQNGTNILFIAIDDMNPILGCYGNDKIISPQMDALAASGVTFLNAHAQWSVCGPSRASLTTSLMPEETGVTGFRKMRGDADNSSRVNNVKRPNVVTLQQYFRYNGYRTAATGKINDYRCVGTLNPATGKVAEDGGAVDDPPSWGDPVDPNNLPVDFFSNSAFVQHASGWDPAGKPAVATTNLADSAFVDGKICEEGITLMQSLASGDTQFFLGVGFKKPHLGFYAPQQYFDLYTQSNFAINAFQDHPLHEVSYTWKYATELASYDDFYDSSPGSTDPAVGIPCTNIPEAKQQELLHGYYACISFIDAQVGRLLAELDAQGLADNTIVVLWGDHGFQLGGHGEWAKHTNLERATRVPLIIRNPFDGQVDVKTDTPAALMDLYPTLCEMAGLPIPEQPLAENEDPFAPASGRALKGQSLASVVSGSESSVRTGAVNLMSRDGHMGYAYRTDRYRYTEWVDAGAVQARELYDYQLDPLETVNLAGEAGYDALMYQYSKAMRKEFDDMKLSGSDIAAPELQGSPIKDTMNGNNMLPALDGSVLGTDVHLDWPDAVGSTYNVLMKTNLLDATWSTNQSGVVGSPTTVPADMQQGFFQIEVEN